MTEKVKVLILASWADSLINFRGALISAMQERGHEVHVAAPSLQKDAAIRLALESKGILVHDVYLDRTGINPVSDIKTFFSLFKLIHRIQPDVFLAYTIKPVIYGSLAAYFAGVPRRYALITGLGYAFTGEVKGLGQLIRTASCRLYKAALRRVDKVFFQNPDDQALFLDVGILNQGVSSIVVNGSGVDISYFKSVPIPIEPIRFLLIARLLGSKGIREYAAAAQKIRQKHPGVRFDIAGWFDDNPDGISKAEFDLWVQDGTLNYLGKLADVRPALADCSVYVLPSYREGTPKTILEAMAMGRPIITTDAPGCRETIVNGENGFLVSVKSVEGLEQAMSTLINEPNLLEKMGGFSRKIAEEKYDVEKVNEIMLQEMELN